VWELALFRSPFQLELRYRKQWRAGTGFTAAMAERTPCPACARVKYAIRTRPERLRISSGKTACGANPGQTHRRGWRLQAQSGFAAIGRAVPVPRNTLAPVPDADAKPAFCMHGINRKGLPAKTGKPFYLFRGGDGGNRSYRKLGFFRNLEGFAGKIQTIKPQRQLSACCVEKRRYVDL
jgi:hypothetical protein